MLTPHQQRTLADNHHISVTANAGSGKTRVLVERYLNILIEGKAEVAEVVALTFTDKAASELKRRVAERIARELGDRPARPRAARLEAIRNQLSLAAILTIHAFCARILREHPVEAGIDAAFGVLEGIDRRTLLHECIADAFSAALGPGAFLRPQLSALLGDFGKRGVTRIVEAMVHKRDQLGRLTGEDGLYRLDDEDIINRWSTELSEHLSTALDDPGLHSDLECLLDAAAGKGAAEARAWYSRFSQTRDLRERGTACRALFGSMVKKDGGLYRSFSGEGHIEERYEAQVRRLAEWRKRNFPLLPLAGEPEAVERVHRALLGRTRVLLAVAGDALDRYERQKRDHGVLDFDDLLIRTKMLLGGEAVRAGLSRRFRYVMVDEYQDTDLLQYEILLPLLDRLASGNLFIVGDPKQSIYGFRNADVRVFERTKQDISRAAGPDAEIILGESFRPLRDLAAFVNLVFSNLMGEDESGSGAPAINAVRYDPLIRARDNDAPGRVELLLSGADRGIPEGDLIAARILRLLDDGTTVYGADEAPRRVRYGDVALLLRSRSSLPAIEDALIRFQIPYAVSAGVGYFQTQDVYDFYGLFRFILNPAEDLALAGILRSPFFDVSDAQLFDLCVGSAEGSLWERLRRAAAVSSPPPPIARAVATLEEALERGLRIPVPELIAWFVRQTHVHAKAAGTVRGDQALANLEKLQRMARRHEALGFTNLYDFVRRLSRLIDEEEREGQGEIESREDAVQVMTVHAAKGLEFPVVILPGLQRKFRYDDEPFIDERLGIGFSGRDEERAGTPLVWHLEQQSRARTLAEEKRIFYVGCTRARDVLLLSSDTGAERGGPDCSRWLFEALDIAGTKEDDHVLRRCSTGVLRFRDGAYESGVEDHTLDIRIVSDGDLARAPQAPAGVVTPRERPPLLFGPLSRIPRGESYSASKIRTYRECPYQYYLRYLLGFPSGGSRMQHPEGDDPPADLRGRLFHGAMQCVGTGAVPHDRIKEELRKVLALEERLTVSGNDRLFAGIIAEVDRMVATSFWRSQADAEELRTEFTISLQLGIDSLTGTLDRVYRDRGGLWHIVDFKTDALGHGASSREGERYWPQMEFYAMLLGKLVHARTIEATLMFTADPDHPLQRRFEQADLLRIEAEVADTLALIRSREFPPRETPCSGCLFLPQGCRTALRLHVAH